MLAVSLMLVASLVQLLLGPIVTFWTCARVREVDAPADPVTSLMLSRWLAGLAGLAAVALIAGLFVAAAFLTQRSEVVSTALVLLSSTPLDDSPTYPPWQAPLLVASSVVWLLVGLAIQGFVAGRLVQRWGYRDTTLDPEHAQLIRRTVFRAEMWTAAIIVLVPTVCLLVYGLALSVS